MNISKLFILCFLFISSSLEASDLKEVLNRASEDFMFNEDTRFHHSQHVENPLSIYDEYHSYKVPNPEIIAQLNSLLTDLPNNPSLQLDNSILKSLDRSNFYCLYMGSAILRSEDSPFRYIGTFGIGDCYSVVGFNSCNQMGFTTHYMQGNDPEFEQLTELINSISLDGEEIEINIISNCFTPALSHAIDFFNCNDISIKGVHINDSTHAISHWHRSNEEEIWSERHEFVLNEYQYGPYPYVKTITFYDPDVFDVQEVNCGQSSFISMQKKEGEFSPISVVLDTQIGKISVLRGFDADSSIGSLCDSIEVTEEELETLKKQQKEEALTRDNRIVLIKRV